MIFLIGIRTRARYDRNKNRLVCSSPCTPSSLSFDAHNLGRLLLFFFLINFISSISIFILLLLSLFFLVFLWDTSLDTCDFCSLAWLCIQRAFYPPTRLLIRYISIFLLKKYIFRFPFVFFI